MVSLREVFDHNIEIGHFVRDWNYLHELLRTMFVELEQGNAAQPEAMGRFTDH